MSTVKINSSTINVPILTDVDFFGVSVANIGDLNNDGIQDIAVGAQGDNGGGTGRGTIHIVFLDAQPLFPNPWMDGGNGTIYYDGGNVGIGITSPNSKLEVTNGYIELDTSSGLPPITDCDDIDELGRMKVDSSSLNLYVCAYDGSTYAWMIIQGISSIQPSWCIGI